MTVEAIWNNVTIARSEKTIELEGNHYFPLDDVDRSYLQESNFTTVCPWKGTAQYFNVKVDDELNADAAWYYPSPKEAAANIDNHIAFWNGVEVREI